MPDKPIGEVAKELAEAHRKEDPATSDVFLAPHPAEVRLVEVSGSLAPSGEVLPFRFGPSCVPRRCLSGHAPTLPASLPVGW